MGGKELYIIKIHVIQAYNLVQTAESKALNTNVLGAFYIMRP